MALAKKGEEAVTDFLTAWLELLGATVITLLMTVVTALLVGVTIWPLWFIFKGYKEF